MHDRSWDGLLDSLAASSPEFVSRFLAALHERALYDPEAIPEDDLVRTAEQTLLVLIERLRGGEASPSDFAESLGRRRARQGVSLDRLVEAIRLDLRLVWQLLREIAGAESTELLVGRVETLIAVVDEHVADVQRSFLGELAILQRDSRLATEQHLSKLFNARMLSPALLEEVASGIRVDPGGGFEMLIAPIASEEHGHREIAPWLARREVFAYVFRGWLLLFRLRPDSSSSWPREFARVPSIYLRSVDGLHRVPEAARAAVELQGRARELRRLTGIEEFWALGAAGYLGALLPDSFGSVLTGLDRVPEDERKRLLRTVREYLDCGSVKETAEIVACHRNTVINRFRQFESCTGLDLTVPAHSALAYIALSGESGEVTGRSFRPV